MIDFVTSPTEARHAVDHDAFTATDFTATVVRVKAMCGRTITVVTRGGTAHIEMIDCRACRAKLRKPRLNERVENTLRRMK